MLNRISEKFADKLVSKKVVAEDRKEVYSYGMMLLLTTILGLLSIVMISTIFFDVFYAMIFIPIFVFLRAFSGGYHCNTYLACFILSNIIFIVVVALSELLASIPSHLFLYANCGVTIVSALYIIINAPVLNPNNPKSKKQIAKNRKVSVILTSIISVAIIAASVALNNYPDIHLYLCIAAFTEFAVSVLMFVIKLEERRRKNV